MPSRREVAQFLKDFKAAISLGYDRWVTRVEDRQHLIDLSITQNVALGLIQALTPDNYSKGPDPDDMNPDREVWVFGCEVADGAEAYIKLALQPHNKKKNVTFGLIWSFHKSEYPLRYPLKENQSQ